MDVREKISLLPHSPGVYRYYDAAGNVIYVGKAKDLAKRVAQYFVDPERLNVKTRVLVSKIADLQYSVVDTEADALLLENNLIKQYKPRYDLFLDRHENLVHNCLQISVSFYFLDQVFGGFLFLGSRGTKDVPFLVSHKDF